MNKKICFFSGGIHRSGGTERVLCLLVNELIKLDYEVIVINFVGVNNKSFFYLNSKVKVINLFSKKINTLLFYPLIIIKLIKILKDKEIKTFIDVDVLLSFYSFIPTRILKIKHIAWEHFNYYSNLGVKRRDFARKIAARYLENIVTLTNEDRLYYLKNLKIKNRIDTIYNPSPFENSEISVIEKKNIAIAVGRLNYQKNFSELLSIWKIIEEKKMGWELQIIGSGEEKEKLLNLSKDLKLKKIVFIENTNKIEEMYKEAKLYLMTSKFEGLPMVLIEAQSFGIPIVSYDCKTGPKDIIINDKTGYIINEGDKENFTIKVIDLMTNSKKLQIFSENSYENSKKFSMENIVLKWKNIL